MLRHPADALPVLHVLALSGVRIGLVCVLDSFWSSLACAFLLLPFQFPVLNCAHHHAHLNVFRPAWQNRLFELFLFFETGGPGYAWNLHHVIGHHGTYRDQSADTLRWQRDDGSPMTRGEYTWHNTLRIYPSIWRIGESHPAMRRHFVAMTVLSLAALAPFFALNPLPALALFGVPIASMAFMLIFSTYWEHVGLDSADPYRASRNIEHALFNRLTWNAGYHTAHHLRPTLHWSELPALHAEVEGRIPSGLRGEWPTEWPAEC